MSPVTEARQRENLPDVSHVIHRGDGAAVTGHSNAVTSVLARSQILQLGVDSGWRAQMTSPMSQGLPRPDPLEKRWPPVLAVLPYGMLAFCVVLSLSLPNPGHDAELTALILSLLSAAWMLWMFTLHPAWRDRPRVMALFISVLIVLGALLVLDQTLFGLYTFTIYFYVIRFLVWP